MIRIGDAGPQTTVQDLGRPGQLRLGIPPSGAMDRDAFVAANRLVDNAPGAAGIECTLMGPRIEVDAPCAIAVTGATVDVGVNGQPVPGWRTVHLEAGDVVKLGVAKTGVRAYVAFSGGVDVPLVLGSRSTYLRGRLGGYEGRALRKGDVLHLFSAPLPKPMSMDPLVREDQDVTITVVLGPQADRFTDEGITTFLENAYEMLPQSDRMGARLRGPRITHMRGHDIISDGIALGSIQVPGDGQPIVLLVDRQSTGGYTKLATVCSFDIGRLAQVKPGRRVKFHAIGVDEAHRLLRAHRANADNGVVPGSAR